MFPYRVVEPNTDFRVTKWDIPINEWLGIKFEAGLHDRFGAVASRFMEDIYEDGPEIGPDEANRRYPTLKFDSPIREERARLMYERKVAELERLSYMEAAEHSWLSGKAALGFGAQLVGGMLHPVDVAAMFIPVVGSSAKAGGIAKLGGGVFRQGLARGLVTREFLAETVKFPQFTAAVIEGAVGNAILEVPLFIQNVRDQAIYGPEDSAVNILAGGLFAGGIRMGISGLGKALEAAAFIHRRTSPEMKEVMFREAANQFLKDTDIAVHEHVKIDDAVIEAKVVFDEAKVRLDAIRSREAQFGQVNESDLIQIAKDQLALDDQRLAVGGESRFGVMAPTFRALAKQAQEASASTETKQNLAALLGLDYQPSARVFPAAYHLVGEKLLRHDLPEFYRSNEAVRQEQARIDQRREADIRAYVAKERATFEANKPSLVAAARQAEVERQRAQGRILPDKEIQRLVTDDPEKAKAILDEDAATLEKDLANEANRRITEDMSPEEKEAIQRELDEEMGQVEEKLYQSREKAIEAAIDCVIESATR